MTKTIEQLKATILELFAELETKPEVKPVLEEGQQYFYITATGEISSDKWDDYGLDKTRLDTGNVFLTQADAEDELKYRKLCYRLLKYTRGVDWAKVGEEKYTLNYNNQDNRLIGGENKYMQYGKLYFPTEEAREVAIKELTNDEWKFYFGYQSRAVVL